MSLFDNAARLTRESFQQQLHTRFQVQNGPGLAELELIEVAANAGHEAGRRECFSIVFRGSPATLLEQRLHILAHPGLGEFILFLVPIRSRVANELWYEAVFVRELLPAK